MKQFFSRLPGVMTAASAVLLAGGVTALAISQAGSASDPLISQSYAEGTYRTSIAQQAADVAAVALDASQDSLDQSLTAVQDAYSDDALRQKLVEQVAAALQGDLLPAQMENGAVLQMEFGAEFCLTSGSANVLSGELLDLTVGQAAAAGTVLTRNHLYLAPEGGASVSMTSPVQVRISGTYTVSDGTVDSYTPQYTAYADALSDLGLFSGGSTGYELERASTRAEGLVMLLRLLGEQAQAAAYTGSHPFIDVPAWAEPYVAYAYAQGYTSGISATEYGSQNTLTMQDYMTFLLRALGYNDSAGDFSWRTAAETAVSYGILTELHREQIAERGVFYRDDIVYTSYQTLFLPCKDTDTLLCDRLIDQGVFTRDQLEAAATQL